jgi:chromosomal replication initiation ATPase DnaA
MTPREKNLADINEIAQEYGYTVDDVLGYSKPKELVKVRRLCVVMLRDKGYSTLAIGRIMHRDHSSIATVLTKARQRHDGKKDKSVSYSWAGSYIFQWRKNVWLYAQENT